MSARSLAADGTDTRIPTGLTSQPVSETYISQPTLARPRGVAEEVRRETLTEHLPKSVTNLPEPALISPEVERPAPVGVASRLGSRVAKIDRRMWMGAAGLLGLAVGVVLIIGSLNAGPSSTMDVTPARVAQATAVAATDADHQPTAATENPQPAATSLTPRSSPASRANLSTTPTSNTPVPANIPTSSRVPTPPPAAQVAKSDDASATPAPENPDEGAEATARHKRLAEERHQRKVEAHLRAQQHADLQAVELQAARLQAQEVQIQQLLLEAKNEYAAGALWQPGGASAADRYREILKIQPGRAEALAGAQRVANVLAAEAARTESVGDADAARVLIDALHSLQPSHPQLAQLQAGLQGLQSTPAVLDARDRARLEKAAGYIAQAYEDLGRTPLDFKAADAATEQYDKAQSAAAQAPGIPLLKERLIAAYADAARTALSQHDSKRALKLINSAHKRHWSSDELEQIEASLGPQVTTPTGPIKQAGATAAAAE